MPERRKFPNETAGTCRECGGRQFRISLFEGGVWEPWCKVCGATWSPAGQPKAQKPDGDKAVGGRGHVPPDLVSPPGRG